MTDDHGPIRARPAPGGRPPHPDGHTIPHPPRPAGPPVTRRQRFYAALIAVIVAVVIFVRVVWW